LDIPLKAQLAALAVLLVISALFSIAETSMMALNRYRLRAMARLGSRAAQRTSELLARTDRLLGVILLGNNLVNAAASVLTGAIAIELLGQNELALAVATGVITFLIVAFSEITPKVIGATFPERIALPLSYVLGPLLKALYPVVWFVNLFSTAFLWLLREGSLDKAALEALLTDPYYVPADTPALTQLQYFQENRQRLALVVDEYGELQGLVTLEDII
jgi:Mg2+/Co2+ transporter CorB